jgi:predicted acylesterase/phospholipase RssA
MGKHDSDSINQAKEILRGQDATPDQLLDLVKKLKGENALGYARRLLALARTKPEVVQNGKHRLKFGQEHALCTYKDRDLPDAHRLEAALKILCEVEDLQTTTNQETLGLVGSIYKLKWQLDTQKGHLERSLSYYFRGYRQSTIKDYGYTAINAAFILDLLASLEAREAKKAGTESTTSAARTEEAKRIREELAVSLPPLLELEGNKWLESAWWFLVTIAEALFGLKRYDDALQWLTKAKGLKDLVRWEQESTTRQLALLAQLQAELEQLPPAQEQLLPQGGGEAKAIEKTKAWRTLCKFLDGDEAGVRTAFSGKVGLGLSGGGFRASLFHIGVLARLAEVDMLRHVEVLSCVSGGSIIGAHYYLEVRKLLQEKADKQITREDYIAIIKRLQDDFLAGVRQNIRTRVAASLKANLKMIVFGNYSRSERVGDLYETEIYSRVADGGNQGLRWLNELAINPRDPPDHFEPKSDNWRRSAKVPILILNATALNTGHNWQFTTSWMGEPPQSGNANSDIDANERFRRMYYEEAPPEHRRIRLGHAVAASACVPGLFEPLVLAGLYPDRTVRLVDGGVHDNQGIASLLESNCTVLLISDGSGQTSSQKDPSNSFIGVPLRTSSILMARVREAEFNNLDSRLQASLLRGLMFLHLKKDLETLSVPWRNCEDPDESPSLSALSDLTSYGILKKIQLLLSGIRTDLDSFSEVEAFALMTSGYRMTEHEYARTIKGFPAPVSEPGIWRFLDIERPMKQIHGCEASHKELARLLKVGSRSAFKIWTLEPVLRYVAIVLGMVLTCALTWWSVTHWSTPLLTVGVIGTAVAVLVGGMIFGKTTMGIVRYRETLERIVIGLAMSSLGWLVAGLHLTVFDRWFLRRGRVERVLKAI